MDPRTGEQREVMQNQFGHNATINQGDVHYHNAHPARVFGFQQTACGTVQIDGTLAPTNHNTNEDFLLQRIDPCYDKTRIERQKGGLLIDSYRWILDHDDFRRWRHATESQLLWIKGDPGKGKTMLLCGIINELEKPPESPTIAYFFCQATDVRLNNAQAVVRGLICRLLRGSSQLDRRDQTYRAAVFHVLQNATTWDMLCKVLFSLLDEPSLQGTHIVIDALDECSTGSRELFWLIIQLSSRTRMLISSRNWPVIEDELSRVAQKTPLCLELNAAAISAAVETYINSKVQDLTLAKNYSKDTQDQVLRYLLSNANNTFLWVALVCQALGSPEVRGWDIKSKLEEFPSGLDELYARMAKPVFIGHNAELCKQVLATMLLAYRPMSLAELFSYLRSHGQVPDEPGFLQQLVELCGSFLTLRGGMIYFVHQSAKDFLMSKLSDQVFSGSMGDQHQKIVLRSIDVMKKALRQNIYGLPSVGASGGQAPDPDPLASARYACVYWIDHLVGGFLEDSINRDVFDGLVHQFLTKHLLHWLEALSLLQSIPFGIRALSRLLSILKDAPLASGRGQLRMLVHDSWRFIRYHKEGLEEGPLQVYSSGLVLSPTQSRVRKLFEQEEPRWIILKPLVEEKWTECLQTLEGHHESVDSLVFSPNGTQLASGSWDLTIKLWDIATGQCERTLGGHRSWVSSIAFSPDGTQLASGSADNTIKLWDITAATGQCERTLEGHSNAVRSIAFSPDGEQLASGSWDHTIKLWDIAAGQCEKTLEGHSSWVISIAFSPDGKQLASGSADYTIKLWDINAATDQYKRTLEGHISGVSSVAFSPDGEQLASGSWDRTIKLWDTATGQYKRTLEGHSSWVNSITFSPDGKQLASGSADYTIKLWDTAAGQCERTLEGHSNAVRSVAFLPDGTQLASGSEDYTIKLWDITAATDHYKRTLEGHSNEVNYVAFSPDGKQLASSSWNRIIKLWDTATGQCRRTLEGHCGWVDSITFSPDGKQLASSSGDSTIKLWDTVTGKCNKTIVTRNIVYTLAFSSTGDYLDTDMGIFKLSSFKGVDATGRQARGSDFFVSGAWIMRSSERLLWLPPEYRSARVAVNGHKVAIGCSSGRVLLFVFSEEEY